MPLGSSVRDEDDRAWSSSVVERRKRVPSDAPTSSVATGPGLAASVAARMSGTAAAATGRRPAPRPRRACRARRGAWSSRPAGRSGSGSGSRGCAGAPRSAPRRRRARARARSLGTAATTVAERGSPVTSDISPIDVAAAQLPDEPALGEDRARRASGVRRATSSSASPRRSRTGSSADSPSSADDVPGSRKRIDAATAQLVGSPRAADAFERRTGTSALERGAFASGQSTLDCASAARALRSGLPEGRSGSSGDDLDRVRQLITGDPGAGEGSRSLGVELGARPRRDVRGERLAHALVGNADHRRLGDVGVRRAGSASTSAGTTLKPPTWTISLARPTMRM